MAEIIKPEAAERLLEDIGQVVVLMQERTTELERVSQDLQRGLADMGQMEERLGTRSDQRLERGFGAGRDLVQELWTNAAAQLKRSGNLVPWKWIGAVTVVVLIITLAINLTWLSRYEGRWQAELKTAKHQVRFGASLEQYLRQELYGKLNEKRQGELDAIYQQYGFRSPGESN